MEINWKPIPGWPYEASEDGRIRRSTPPHSRGGYTAVGRELSQAETGTGYLQVTLCDGPGNRQSLGVHTLVAAAFFGEAPYPGYLVAHKDNNGRNNHISNLRWTTQQDNCMDKHGHGTIPLGESHANAKLTDAAVRDIRREHAEAKDGKHRAPKGTNTALAVRYGVTVTTIKHIVRGDGWRHVI